ncbi:MAG: hypothetical protein EZS28_038197, partial [Streblomastix strix]
MSNNEEKNKALIEKKNQEEDDDEGEWEEYSESSSESNSSDNKKKPIFIPIAPQLNKLPSKFIKRFEIQIEIDELINNVSTPYQKSNDEAILLLISNKWRQEKIDNFYSSNYEECLKAAGYDCVARHICSQFLDGSASISIACLEGGCFGRIYPSMIRQVLSSYLYQQEGVGGRKIEGEKAVEQFNEYIQEDYISNNTDKFHYCPNPKCSYITKRNNLLMNDIRC